MLTAQTIQAIVATGDIHANRGSCTIRPSCRSKSIHCTSDFRDGLTKNFGSVYKNFDIQTMNSSPAPHHARPHILPQQLYFRIPEFSLESGEVFLDAQVAFTFRGLLNAERDNAIIICHGLTESADIEDWWSPMLERVNPALDSGKYSIICCNYLGSPFGSSSPLTYRPGPEGKTERYASQFPRTTFRDDVQ